MRKPKMILFDYGQTLADEQVFDGIRGNEALLRHAVKNKYGRTAEEISAFAKKLDDELGRFDPQRAHLFQIEIPNSAFCAYIYESLGIELNMTNTELDTLFWDAAAPGVPTDGLQEFLAFLKAQNIRTGVISNISYCGAAVKARIQKMLPDHDFEFIISTCDYLFRKPNRRIFDLALEKAGLHAEDVWYIGDKYDCDVVGAQNAGLVPVWYVGAARSPASERDVLTISHWDELKMLLLQQIE